MSHFTVALVKGHCDRGMLSPGAMGDQLVVAEIPCEQGDNNNYRG